MTAQIMYDIITEAEVYEREEELATLRNIYKSYHSKKIISYKEKIAPLVEWLNDNLDMLNIPEGTFRKMYIDGFLEYDDELENLIQHIQQCIYADSDEEEEDQEKED